MPAIDTGFSNAIGNGFAPAADTIQRNTDGSTDIGALAQSITAQAAGDPAGAYQRLTAASATLRPVEQGELARTVGNGIFEPGNPAPHGPGNPNYPLPRGPFPLPEWPKDGPGFPRLPGGSNDNPNFPLPRGPFPLPDWPKDGPGFPRLPGGSHDNPNFPLPRGPFPDPLPQWPENGGGIPHCWPVPEDNPNFPLPEGPFPLPGNNGPTDCWPIPD